MFLDNIVNQNKSVKAKQGYTQDVTLSFIILYRIKAYIQLQYLISLRHHNSGEKVQSYHRYNASNQVMSLSMTNN